MGHGKFKNIGVGQRDSDIFKPEDTREGRNLREGGKCNAFRGECQ